MRSFFQVFAFLIFLFPCASFADEAREEVKLVNYFYAVKFLTWANISEKLSPHFDGISKKQSIALLRENGFSTTIVSKEMMKPEDHAQMQRDARVEFDDYIVGQRGPGLRFWRVADVYTITILVKDDIVIRTFATANSFSLIPE